MGLRCRRITDRHEWLQWRKAYLCASETAAAVGLDPYVTPLQLYAEKTGMAAGAFETPVMKRGRLLEGPAIELLRERLDGQRVVQPGVFLSDDELRLGCTPDALTEDDDGLVNLQIKTINRSTLDRWDGVPPIGYQMQVVAENLLLNAAKGVLVALVVGMFDLSIELFDIPRHADAESRIKAIALDFWRNIEAGKRPAADYSRDAALIAEIAPGLDQGLELDWSGDNRAQHLLAERWYAKETGLAAEQKIAAIDAELRDKLGGAVAATLPGWRVTLKQQWRNGYTVKPWTGRVLRVTGKEEAVQ
jgi:putative phage-type endonuclease